MSNPLGIGLLIYLCVIITIFIISRWKFRTNAWSSLAVSLVIGLVVLSIIFPMSSLYHVRKQKALVFIYILIVAITIIVVIVYIIDKASKDRDFSNYSLIEKDLGPMSQAPELRYMLA